MTFDALDLDGAIDVPIDLVRAVSVDSTDSLGYPGPHEAMGSYTDEGNVAYDT